MNTQTFAQDQDFTAITDEELMAVTDEELIAVNGGGGGECKVYYDLTSSDCLSY